MVLYVMRHGTTVWNEIGRSQGRSQNRLSKNGKLVAQASAQKLKDVKFDIIFSSPLCRTIQTANIVNKYHNVKILKDDRLIEFDQGWFTGKLVKTLTEEQKQARINRDPKYGMENLKAVYARSRNFFDYLKENYNDKTVLVVTHNAIASCLDLITQYGDYDNEHFKVMNHFDNAEFKRFEI
ncbi:MAG: histidine phosphatase family protein [Clostridia bacterium]|nr:histidine phosphatase family protein [Clostridia bacterium]